MHSLTPQFLENIQFGQSELATFRTLGEFRGKQRLFVRQSPEILSSLQGIAIVESTESSNRLEGISLSHRRIEELVLHHNKPKNRSEQEVAGYRDALALIHKSARDIPFSINVILQLHQTIYKFMPAAGGRWKTADNQIIERLPDGSSRIRFTPTAALETPVAMQRLVTAFTEAVESGVSDPLVLLPAAILDFLCIHPFLDGNGRVARLLTLLLLYHFDYQVGRYISLERVIEETKEDYYRTLRESSQGWHSQRHNLMPWLNYFWLMITAAYQEFEQRAGNVKSGRGAKTDQVKQVIARQPGTFAISDIEKQCPWISRDMIRLVLREQRDAGMIRSLGKGRSARWEKIC